MHDALPILANIFAASAVAFALLWFISITLKDPSFVDSWWALGAAGLAWLTFVQSPEAGQHTYALVAIASLWGARLGLYLLWRWLKHGPDNRYVKMAADAKQNRGFGFAAFALLIVFIPQMLLQFLMALPVTLGQIGAPRTLGSLAMFGLALSLFGIFYEAIADAQLARFKADASNRGKVMDRGLWRYSRHPNYFGEMCTWWGAFLIALEAPYGQWTLPGPLLLTFLLTRVSGAPTTEPHLHKTRPDYEAYKARTSAYIPLPPKRDG